MFPFQSFTLPPFTSPSWSHFTLQSVKDACSCTRYSSDVPEQMLWKGNTKIYTEHTGSLFKVISPAQQDPQPSNYFSLTSPQNKQSCLQLFKYPTQDVGWRIPNVLPHDALGYRPHKFGKLQKLSDSDDTLGNLIVKTSRLVKQHT